MGDSRVSPEVLEVPPRAARGLVGLSPGPTGSSNTKTASLKATTRQRAPAARYVYYGIREHAMAAAMNGMARCMAPPSPPRTSWSSPTTAARRSVSRGADGPARHQKMTHGRSVSARTVRRINQSANISRPCAPSPAPAHMRQADT